MLIVSRTGDESTRNPTGRPTYRRHVGWRALAVLAACASAACAEAPSGTEFLIRLDSGAQTGDVDSSMPIDNEPPPEDLGGGGTPGFTLPPFGQDASVQAPTPDASRPPTPTPDAGRPPVNPTTPDASRPPVPDAAGPVVTPTPDASTPQPTGQTCGTTPAFATPDACSKCICMQCAAPVASCYASTDTAKNGLCKAVRDCAMQNHCTRDQCYCADALCFTAGPCVAVIDNAASPATPTAARDDPESPLGRSNAVGMCSVSNCASECGLQ